MKILVMVRRPPEIPVEVPEGTTLHDLSLLPRVGASSRVYEAKVNDQPVAKGEWQKTILRDGQHVKFVSLVK